jgi:hypothetical protein
MPHIVIDEIWPVSVRPRRASALELIGSAPIRWFKAGRLRVRQAKYEQVRLPPIQRGSGPIPLVGVGNDGDFAAHRFVLKPAPA